mgnify:CR=1 FL=1
MGDPSLLFWGILFGVLGLAYFVYGRKQKAMVPLFVGIALCALPYFVTNVFVLVIVGFILAVLPYFVRI